MTGTLAKIEDAIATIMLAIALIVVFMEMIARGAFQTSFMWSGELSRYALIWMTYLGASMLVQSNQHIRVEFFLNRLSPSARCAVEVLIVLLCLVFTGMVCAVGIEYVKESWTMGLVSADSNLAIPIWVFQSIIPISYFLMSLHLISRGVRLVRRKSVTDTEMGIK